VITASALVRGEGKLLLVYQQRKQDPYAMWALPGGRLEGGESLAHGLVREVREESGLTIGRVGTLVSVAHVVNRTKGTQAVSFVFEVEEWTGEVAPADPDGVVQEARFFGVEEAAEQMSKSVWRAMYEPVNAYLRGSQGAGVVWLYAEHDGEQKLLASLPEEAGGELWRREAPDNR
jgi:ADP-ribose pyrophosphatase YjhB (NUDIX family)